MSKIITRNVPLDDIAVEKDGTGRTVTAYAAIFDTPEPIQDHQGRYIEQIARSAFNKTLAQRSRPVGVFYNHGATLHGTPSERHSMPLGTPLEIKADSKGLLTRTRYNTTSLANDVLDAIKNGDITGQSFSGRMIQSTPDLPNSGRYSPMRSGEDVLVTRMEIALTEYGPTPMPAYVGANIVGVRASSLDTIDSALLQLLLANIEDADDALDPIVMALCKTSGVLDQAQAFLAAILGAANPDANAADEAAMMPEGMDRAAWRRFLTLSSRLDAKRAEHDASTPTGAAAGEPVSDHSRPVLHAHEVRARLLKMGLTA